MLWKNVGRTLTAGFGQIEAQVMKVGMIAEVTCVSKPFTIIPMVATDLQEYIAAGQFRGGEQLIDPQQVTKPGTLMTFLEPLYEGGLVRPSVGERASGGPEDLLAILEQPTPIFCGHLNAVRNEVPIGLQPFGNGAGRCHFARQFGPNRASAKV
jgi:hypothetical protein